MELDIGLTSNVSGCFIVPCPASVALGGGECVVQRLFKGHETLQDILSKVVQVFYRDLLWLLGTRRLLGARMLLGAPGIATRNKNARNGATLVVRKKKKKKKQTTKKQVF